VQTSAVCRQSAIPGDDHGHDREPTPGNRQAFRQATVHHARHGDGRFRCDILGVGPALTSGSAFQAVTGTEQFPASPGRGRPGDRRCAGPHSGWCHDRPVRRPADVPGHLARHHHPGSVPGPSRVSLTGGPAHRRVLPRPGRHLVRGRGAIRQRLVLSRATGRSDRRFRHGHGRDRDQRPDHHQAGRSREHSHSVFHRGRRAGGVRHRRRGGLARCAGPAGADPARALPPRRHGEAADHLAGFSLVRGGVRRVRRLQRVPAD